MRSQTHYDKEAFGGETPTGRSPMTMPNRSSKNTRDLGFFGDGVNSESLGAFSRTSQNSFCSTTCDSGSPKPMTASAMLERKFSRGSLLDSPSPSKSEERSPKSVALLLAKCLQSGMDTEPDTSNEVRPIHAASGLILKSPKRRETEKILSKGDRSNLPSRMLSRQKTSPPGFFRPDESLLGSMSITGSSDFPVVKGFRQLEKEKIFDLYQWSEVLQEAGDGGKVVVCQPKSGYDEVPYRTYVLKMRSKQSLRKNSMEEQFRKSLFTLLNMPEHGGVLPLQEVLEDQQFYYIVMEKAKGGSLFDGLLKQFEDGHMPPKEVRHLMKGILEAVGHIHQQGMLHRDIKPDNLVMRRDDVWGEPGSPKVDGSGKGLRVAIIDFDHADPDYLSKCSKQSETPSDYFCGTVQFSAPEAFFGSFSPASDLYSTGIILYLLMAGKMPFDNSIYKEEMSVLQQSPKSRTWTSNLYKRLKSEPLDWSCDPWPEQPQCRSFCQWLLAFEPGKRPSSAAEALEHDWFVILEDEPEVRNV